MTRFRFAGLRTSSIARVLPAGVLMLALVAPIGSAQAEPDTILHAFAGGNDGWNPAAGLIADAAGNLYGTTEYGGGGYYGTVFKLAPDGTEAILHVFNTAGDGAQPDAGLVADNAGNLYGTTFKGGASNLGTVFEISAAGKEKVLHSFAGIDGFYPEAGLIMDGGGNLYGTTVGGGGIGCAYGCGTVFKLAPDGTETVLHSFSGGSDGIAPLAGLLADGAGNLYGTTDEGGGIGCSGYGGCGTVFKLAPDGTETVLHAFGGGSDGAYPAAGLIADSAGNLYGTTSYGGTGCSGGCGTVFKLAPDGTETILHSFLGGKTDGAFPVAGLIADGAGSLYGTTSFDGGGGGTVFKLAPDGTETVLHTFRPIINGDGRRPSAGLIKKGPYLLGTTSGGGSIGGNCFRRGCGTVFELLK